MPVTLQFGLVKIYQSGMFAVVDSLLAIQMKYDCFSWLPSSSQIQHRFKACVGRIMSLQIMT